MTKALIAACFAWALGQLVYDVPDDGRGMASALRGHGLARTMYGHNDQTLNTQPFNGTGRLHFTHAADAGAIGGADDHGLVNYQAFGGEALRDPERYGTRRHADEPRPFYTGGFNGPYTYPDLNNLSLAAARSDGTLIAPSFHRDWLFGPLDASNPNWTSPQGKYLLLRPRPAEMGPGFPFPESGPDGQGDVKNRRDAPGGNDSVWIDLGYPVQTAPDGRKFKPLFAFYVEDLDGRAPSGLGGVRIASTTPWLWDRALESFYVVPTGDPEGAPAGPAVALPELTRRGDPFGNPGEPVPAFSDFRTPGLPPSDPDADWRGFRAPSLVARGTDPKALGRLAAALGGRVDLNRPLPDYPRAAVFATPSELQHANTALRARQELAEEIYRRLLVVTGAPAPQPASGNPSDDELSVLRWLAQLAVNIVDYIDEDDISTAFNFYSPALDGLPAADVARGTPTPAGETIPRYWVFGTELPSVVLNEVMTQAMVSTPDAVAVRVWAELHRPERHPDATPVTLFTRTGGPGQGYSPYLVVVARTGSRTALFDRPDNVVGSPDAVHGIAAFGPTLGTVGNPDATVPASVGAERYLIVGPRSDGGQDAERTIQPTDARPGATRWLRSDGMEFTVGSDATAAGVTVLLRRLANPHLPPDPRPVVGGTANPLYNPYITVDYLESIPVRAREAGGQSLGKLQPFAAHPDRIQPQTTQQAANTRHTLGEANQPRQPSDWLVHLDRPLISALELLSVAGVRPHELTHRFITTPAHEPADFAHRAPWLDEDLAPTSPRRSHRLYRLFEYVETGDRGRGTGGHGRGPANINTVHDLAAFRELVGEGVEAQFGPDTIVRIWERLLQLRSPGMAGMRPGPTAADRPFQSPAVGILPASDPQANGRGVGIDDTIFRAWDPTTAGDSPRLFDVAGQDHPYLEKALLTAIADRLAVRSNVFAVWVTVGFFEVVDDTSSPIKLGAEIGRAANAVRPRFFAIVDRSRLQLFGRQLVGGRMAVTRHLTRSHDAVAAAGRRWVALEALSGLTATEARDAAGAPTGRFLTWTIVPGSQLFVDTGPEREIVVVTDVDPARNAIEAAFSRPHARGFEISMPGNPGPQPAFDPNAALFHDVVIRADRLD